MSTRFVDVFVFDDNQDQVRRIADWLGLEVDANVSRPRFSQASASGQCPTEGGERGWKWIATEVTRVDQELATFDDLLSNNLGLKSFISK